MYVQLPTLQKFLFDGRTDRISRIQIEFNESVDPKIVERWQAKLSVADPLLKVRLMRTSAKTSTPICRPCMC